MAKGGEFVLPSDKLPEGIFTVNDLTEEHGLIRQTMREFMANEVMTDAAIKRIESKDFGFQRELLRKLADLGVLGAEVPETYGGQGLDKIAGAIIAEEIAKQGSFATTFLAHTGIGTLPIRFFGTEEQKKKYLPKLVSGEWVASYCLTEGGAGSDAGGVKTTAKPHLIDDVNRYAETYLLNGEKIFVTNGGFADLFIVFAQLQGVGLTAFIVEKTYPGLIPGKEEHKMGIQGSSTSTITLNDVLVTADNILGEPGKGFKIALNILNLGRFKLAAASLGGGRLGLEQALKYSQERKQFGNPISNFGTIRQKLALMAAKVYSMESVVYRTAGHLEEAIGKVDANDSKAVLKAIEEFVVECSLVKVSCSEALDYIVDENVQIHGGSGFCEGSPERQYRDSRVNRIFEGTNEVNRLLLVGMTLKKAATGSLPLMQTVKRVVGESMTSSMQTESEDLIERLTYYLNNAKKAVLLAAGLAYDKYNIKLEEHQILLMNLSDCLINIFVMESSLVSFAQNKMDSNARLVQLMFDDCLFLVDRLVKEIITMSAEGDTKITTLAMVRRLLKFTPVNKEELCNQIAEDLIKRG